MALMIVKVRSQSLLKVSLYSVNSIIDVKHLSYNNIKRKAPNIDIINLQSERISFGKRKKTIKLKSNKNTLQHWDFDKSRRLQTTKVSSLRRTQKNFWNRKSIDSQSTKMATITNERKIDKSWTPFAKHRKSLQGTQKKSGNLLHRRSQGVPPLNL